MSHRRAWRSGVLLVLAASALVPSCRGRKAAEVNAIVPSFAVNRVRAPLGSAVEVTYTWTCEPTMKKLTEDHRAFIHFVDPHGIVLYTDDHVPTPATSTWEPGKTYTYARTVFIPIYPYVGEVDVRAGLQPLSGKGARVQLKGEDAGLREFKVGKMEWLPQTENVFLVFKEGWHSPESTPQNPSLERTWTKREALVSFKNPKKDILIYLEADTNYKAFKKPPVLTLSTAGTTGVMIPIATSEVFLKKLRFKAQDLGQGEWVDLRFTMSESFVPASLGINNDDRELGLLEYHLHVVEADKVGAQPSEGIVDAAPLPPAMVAALKVPIVAAVPKAAVKAAPTPAKTAASPASGTKPASATKVTPTPAKKS